MKNRRWLNGSFTVEAAFLMPVIIACFVMILSLCLGLYENVVKTAESYANLTEFDAVGLFRNVAIGTEILSAVKK